MWKIWAAKHTFFNGGGDAHFEKRGGAGLVQKRTPSPIKEPHKGSQLVNDINNRS